MFKLKSVVGDEYVTLMSCASIEMSHVFFMIGP